MSWKDTEEEESCTGIEMGPGGWEGTRKLTSGNWEAWEGRSWVLLISSDGIVDWKEGDGAGAVLG